MEVAEVISKRSTCLRRQVGAVLVLEDHIIATGYNGAPKNLPHCSETGCVREAQNIPSGQRHELCRANHSEANAIIFSHCNTNGSVLYVTCFPCVMCAKILINAGVKKVIYKGDYPDELSKEMLESSGVTVQKF
ncbi:deoxycytidylate deaminase [Pelotomaculum propionicicum]|uniref:deoxycytidylate deaminase n=1 Tax=Pelotomaculum propionicicum TaxID=258475 RepID=UPI003B7C1BD0